MDKQNIVRTTVWFTVVMCIGYFISFAKEAIVANYFGVSKDVDAYTVALQIPVVLFAVVAVAIQSVVVPLYSDLLYKESLETANKFANNLLISVLLLTLVLFISGETFAEQIIYLFAPGFPTEIHDLATKLLRITFPTIFFSLVAQVFSAILNVHKKYVIPSLGVMILNTVLIMTIVYLHSKYGIISACIGQIFGSVAQLLFLSILIRRYFTWQFVINLNEPTLKDALKMSIPVFWSTSVAEINAITNKMVASFLFVGSIAALGYAQKINTIFISLFTSAIATIMYPLYAESAAKGNIEQLNSRFNLIMSAYSFFLLPLMSYVVCLRKEIVIVAFGRGAFDTNAISLTEQLLGYYALGIVFFALRGTLTNVFYSLKDSKTPAKNATIGVVINIVLNLTLPFIFGICGLAIATTLSAVYITLMLVILLLKKNQGLDLKLFSTNIKRISVATLISFVMTSTAHYFFDTVNPTMSLILCLLITTITYILAIYLMKAPIANLLYQKILQRKGE